MASLMYCMTEGVSCARAFRRFTTAWLRGGVTQPQSASGSGSGSLRERDEKLSCLRQEMLLMADSVYVEAKKLPLIPRMFERGVGSFEVRGRIVERLDEKGRRGGTLLLVSDQDEPTQLYTSR